MKKKKVAIIGGSASREEAPYDCPTWEIWSCNEMSASRFDRHFELHPMNVQNERELEWLRNCDKPIYVLNKKDALSCGIKNTIEYPYDEIMKHSWAMPYFCCTMAYQIAFAIHEGFQTIGLWGLRMDIGSPRERTVESACIQHWLGVAKGKGIEVIWSEHPAENRFLYGYNYHIEIENVDAWLYQLAIHTIYRLGGKHICVGGDSDPIRKKDTERTINRYLLIKALAELKEWEKWVGDVDGCDASDLGSIPYPDEDVIKDLENYIKQK